MLAAVLHLSTALPKPSAAALKPAAQMDATHDATLVTKLNSGGWKGPTVTELESEAPFEGGGWKCPADKPYAYGGGADCCSEEVDFQAESCTGTTSRCPSGQTRTKMDMCSPIPSTGSSGCAGYCDKHTTSWEWKCFWSAGVCSTCDECTAWNAPVGPRCEPWCERHTKDWTTKCSWKSEECSTCDGCIAPSFPPPPYTPPVPSTQPPSPPWEYSSAICRSQHNVDLFFKNPHLDDCPAGDGGLLMCSQATTVGTLCYYSVGNTCGSAAEAPLQPYSCCVAGNKDATCNGGNVILQVAIPPPSPPSPPLPPYTPPPASFWGAGKAGPGGSFGLNLHGISKVSWPPTCASNNPTYNKHQKYYINMGMKTWPECMQLAAEHKMQVNGEAGNSNIYPAWSPIITSDGAGAWGYSSNWVIPRQVEIWNKFYCTLTKDSFGTFPEYKNAYDGAYLNDPSSWLSAQVAFPMRAGPLPCKGAKYWNTDSPCTWSQCMHFKYVDVGVVTPYMCQIIAASNGASVLSSSTLGLGNIKTAMPSFHSCDTVWHWDGTKPVSTQPRTVRSDDYEGPPFQCYIGYLDHLC